MFQNSPTTVACRLAPRKTYNFQRSIVLVTNSVWVVVGLLKRREPIVRNTEAIWCMDWGGRRLAFCWQNWSVENLTSELNWCGSGRSASQEYQGHGDGLTVSLFSSAFLAMTPSFTLTPSSWVILEKPILPQLLKELTLLYGKRNFITVFTTADHVCPTWTRSIQSTPSPNNLFRTNLILSPHRHLRLPSGIHQNPVCISPLPHTCYMPHPYHYSRFHHLNNI